MLNNLELIKTKVKELQKETIDKYKIVKKLQEVNNCFLTEYKLKFKYEGKTINIIPIETEIYYQNENIDKKIFEDKMIHKNELQQKRFGQLYFHRKGILKDNKILCATTKTWGGVDVCLSDSDDYYLSILIRSAFITRDIKVFKNNIEEKIYFVSGIRKICNTIKNFFNPQENLLKFFGKIEDKTNIIQAQEGEINTDNIFYQQRISGKDFSQKDLEYQKLNCLNLGPNYQYLEWIKNQRFYTVTKKGEIKDRFENIDR